MSGTDPEGIEELFAKPVEKKIGKKLPPEKQVTVTFKPIDLDIVPLVKDLEKLLAAINKAESEGMDELDPEQMKLIYKVLAMTTNLSEAALQKLRMDFLMEVFEGFMEANEYMMEAKDEIDKNARIMQVIQQKKRIVAEEKAKAEAEKKDGTGRAEQTEGSPAPQE